MKLKNCLIYNILLLLCLINIKAKALSVVGIDTIYKEQIIKVGQQKLNTLILQNEQYLKEGKTDKLNFVVNVNPEDYIEDRSIANKPSYLSSTSVETSFNARLNQVASTYNISCYYILISYLDVKISAIMPDQYTLDELFNTGKFFQENTNINEMKQYHDDITKNIISNVTSASRNYFVFSMAKYYASEFHNSLGYYNFYKTDTVRVAGSPEILHFKDTYTYFKTHLKNNKEFKTTQLSDTRVDKAISSLESAAKNAPLKAQILTTYTTAGLKSILDAFSGYTDYITLSVAERIHVISVMLNDAIFGSSFTAEEIYTINIIKSVPSNDVKNFLTALEQPSVLNTNPNYTGNKTNSSALIYRLIDAMDDVGPGGDNYTEMMKHFNSIIETSPDYNTWCAEMMSDEEFDKRIMNWGEGNDNYTKIADVALNTSGTLNITKQDLEVSCDTLNKNSFNQEIACYGTWISSPAFNLSPFKLIMFTNFSNISAIDEGAKSMKGTAKIVPAIYLKYSKDKETNYKIEKGIIYTIDGLSLISGVGTVLNGGFKALNWGRKAWIVYNTSVATANILVNASDIPNDPDFQDAYQAYTAITIASGLGELSYNGIKNFSSCLRTTKNIANTTTQITKQQYLNLINKLDAVYVKLQSGALTLNANGMKAYKKLKAYTDRLKQNWQKLFKEPLPVGVQGAGNFTKYTNIRSFLGDGKVKAYLNNQQLLDFENVLKSANDDVLKVIDEFKSADEFTEMVRGYKDGLQLNPSGFINAIKTTETFSGTYGWLKFWRLTPRMQNSLNTITQLKNGNKIANVGTATDIQLSSIHAYTANGDFINVPYRYNPTWFGEYNTRAVKHINEGLDELRKIPQRVVRNEEVFSGKTFSKVDFESKFVGKNNTVHNYNGYMSTSKLESVAEGFIDLTKQWATGSGEKIAVIQRVISKNGVYIDDISDWGRNLGTTNHPDSKFLKVQVQEEVLLNSEKLKQISEPIPIIENGMHKTIDGMKVYYVDFVEIL